MKRAIFSIILFLLLCFLSNHTIDYTMGRQIENRSPYSLAFASIGAISLESRLDCWAKLRTSSTETEMEGYMQDLAASLSLEYHPDNVLLHFEADAAEMEYSILHDGVKYYLALQSNDNCGETHFIVSAETSQKDKSMTQIKRQLESLRILEWHDYYLYKGEMTNVLDHSGIVDLTKVIMKNLDAVMLDTYQEGMCFSSTGYSKKMENIIKPVWADDQRYNVQVAFYSSPSQDKTYVYIGFPLIVGNY